MMGWCLLGSSSTADFWHSCMNEAEWRGTHHVNSKREDLANHSSSKEADRQSHGPVFLRSVS